VRQSADNVRSALAFLGNSVGVSAETEGAVVSDPQEGRVCFGSDGGSFYNDS